MKRIKKLCLVLLVLFESLMLSHCDFPCEYSSRCSQIKSQWLIIALAGNKTSQREKASFLEKKPIIDWKKIGCGDAYLLSSVTWKPMRGRWSLRSFCDFSAMSCARASLILSSCRRTSSLMSFWSRRMSSISLRRLSTVCSIRSSRVARWLSG